MIFNEEKNKNKKEKNYNIINLVRLIINKIK